MSIRRQPIIQLPKLWAVRAARSRWRLSLREPALRAGRLATARAIAPLLIRAVHIC